MSDAENKIKDYVIAREGEVEGLENFLLHVSERGHAFKDNVERVQVTSSAILATLDRLNTSIDSQLLKLDATNSETLVQQLLDVITETRRNIRNEEQLIVREYGFVYLSLNTANETAKTLTEKIESAKTSVNNQKILLEKAATGDHNQRAVGDRPVALKDRRKFDEIVNNDEKSD
jgi:hypothetical protein